MNLDPFDTHEDRELWQALERVHLKEYVQQLPLKLESQVMPGMHIW